jgi:hypothetical protein
MEPQWEYGIFLSMADLERLKNFINEKLSDLRKRASSDLTMPEGVVNKWDRGQCIFQLISTKIVGRPVEIDTATGCARIPEE